MIQKITRWSHREGVTIVQLLKIFLSNNLTSDKYFKVQCRPSGEWFCSKWSTFSRQVVVSHDHMQQPHLNCHNYLSYPMCRNNFRHMDIFSQMEFLVIYIVGNRTKYKESLA